MAAGRNRPALKGALSEGARPRGGGRLPQGARAEVQNGGPADIRAAKNLAPATGAGGGVTVNSRPRRG